MDNILAHRDRNQSSNSDAENCSPFKYSCERKLQSFLNVCLRSFLKIWWSLRVSNVELWKRTGYDDASMEFKYDVLIKQKLSAT